MSKQHFEVDLRYLLFSIALMSCQSRLVSLSQRSLQNPLPVPSPNAMPSPEQKVLLERREWDIVPAAPERSLGSLYESKHARNRLFAEVPRFDLGTYVDLQVNRNRPTPSPSPKAEPSPSPSPVLPPLSSRSAIEGQPPLLTNLKMKIIKTFTNGDVLVQLNRRSESESEIVTISAKAIIPAAALRRKTQSTSDLVEVEFNRAQDGEASVKRSAVWEDEYTEAVSGFREAQSRYAVELEQRARQLEGVREQLNGRAEALGKERNQFVKEREKWAQEHSGSVKPSTPPLPAAIAAPSPNPSPMEPRP